MGEGKRRGDPTRKLITPGEGQQPRREQTARIKADLLRERLDASKQARLSREREINMSEVTAPIPVVDLQQMLKRCQAAAAVRKLSQNKRDSDLEWIPAPEEFEGPESTQPIDADTLREKRTECWVDSPEDDLQITVEPMAQPPPVPPSVPSPKDRTKAPVRPPAEAHRGGRVPAIVAMDFGTTRCRVAALINGTVYLLPLKNGQPDMPAVVGFDESGNAVVGDKARVMLASDPANVIAAPRRLLGRLYRDQRIAGLLAELPIRSSEGPNGEVVLHTRGQAYAVTQVCSTLLYRLRVAAERHLKQQITEVVLTTPVDFDERQTGALARAAQMAGLEVLQFVEEPVAAAVANRFDPDFRDLVGIYDFGGATFDFSVVDLNEQMRVVASASDPWLGGNDFEEVLASAAANHFWWKHKIELRHQVVQWQRLLLMAERAKRELSERDQTVLKLDRVAHTSGGSVNVHFPISREEFVQLSKELIDRSLDTCKEALESRNLAASDLNTVFFSSGTSYIPAVQQAVGRFFGRALKPGVAPERAILLGAAIYTTCLRQARQGKSLQLQQ